MVSFITTAVISQTKALVGGTLIDGYGSHPIRNSVIIIEGEKIAKVGTVGQIEIPANAEIISTEGMTVLPGLWDMHVHLMINGHADYDYWDKTYPPLFEKVIMPSSAHQLLMAALTYNLKKYLKFVVKKPLPNRSSIDKCRENTTYSKNSAF